MIIFAHAVAGSVLGRYIPEPIISVPLSFGSHFLLDMIPHAQAPSDSGYVPNKKTYLYVSVDLLATIFFVIYLSLAGILTPNILLCIIFAILPDIIDTSRYLKSLFKKFSFYYNFHDKIQNETSSFVGYLSQIVLIIGSLILLGVL